MTPISEKLLKENGWHQLNYNWIKSERLLVFSHTEKKWKIKGKVVEYMEDLQKTEPNEKSINSTNSSNFS